MGVKRLEKAEATTPEVASRGTHTTFLVFFLTVGLSRCPDVWIRSRTRCGVSISFRNVMSPIIGHSRPSGSGPCRPRRWGVVSGWGCEWACKEQAGAASSTGLVLWEGGMKPVSGGVQSEAGVGTWGQAWGLGVGWLRLLVPRVPCCFVLRQDKGVGTGDEEKAWFLDQSPQVNPGGR